MHDIGAADYVPAGHYKTSPALGEQKESKRSTSSRAVFGTATRAGQEKVGRAAASAAAW
jgi:hypothetical protein